MNGETNVKESVHRTIQNKLIANLKTENIHITDLTKLCNYLQDELEEKDKQIESLRGRLAKSAELLDRVIAEVTRE